MKKMIITATLFLATVTSADAGRVKCEIVQVLPGFYLPQCERYNRSFSRSHYRDDNWRSHERSSWRNGYARNNYRDDRYNEKRRTYGMNRNMHDRPHHRDKFRW